MSTVPSNFQPGKLTATLLAFASVFQDIALSPQEFPSFKWFSSCISLRHVSVVSPILVILVIWSPLFSEQKIGEETVVETWASCCRNHLPWGNLGKNPLHFQNNLPTSHHRLYPPQPYSHFTGNFRSDKPLLFHERAVLSGSKASTENCRDVWAGKGRD